MWNEVEEIGLPKIVVKEKFDGFNLEFASALPIIQLSNSLGAPIPLSETILCNYILFVFLPYCKNVTGKI